jgi:hypothetical protein
VPGSPKRFERWPLPAYDGQRVVNLNEADQRRSSW